MMGLKVLRGGSHSDERGKLSFINDFNASEVKRIYCIENRDTSFQRGWQGHTTEKRWFSAIQGRFRIQVIKIDDWENPSKDLQSTSFIICDTSFDVLYVPEGHITCLQALEKNARLLVMADYLLGEVKDEFRYPIDYFNL